MQATIHRYASSRVNFRTPRRLRDVVLSGLPKPNLTSLSMSTPSNNNNNYYYYNATARRVFFSTQVHGYDAATASWRPRQKSQTRTAQAGASLSSAVQVAYEEESDDDKLELDELEQLTTRYMEQQFVPHHHYNNKYHYQGGLSNLDLELGELGEEETTSSWYDGERSLLVEEEEVDLEDGLPTTEDDDGDELAQKKAAVKPKSPMEILLKFDPQNPPSSNCMHDLQLWLECEAQRECVARYQKTLEAARDRRDYGSLPMVQRQVLRWFPALKERIAAMQREFVLNEKSGDDDDVVVADDNETTVSTENDSKVQRKKRKKTPVSGKKFGPYLCTLSPEKLAVITAHATLLLCLLKGGTNGSAGVAFVAVAKHIGECVEEEVLIHRMLYERFKERQKKAAAEATADGSAGIEPSDDALFAELANVSSETDNSEAAEEESADVDEFSKKTGGLNAGDYKATRQWVYAASHLKEYIEELTKNGLSNKKRHVIGYAVRRARQVLEKDEPWTEHEKVHLGAALFKVLLENASIMVDGNDEMAFVYEKFWTHKRKMTSHVSLNDKLYKMVVSDNLNSLAPLTTRYKPMILPPKPWTSADRGGYLWLKSDLMRYHGSEQQKEALECADMSTLYDGLNVLGGVPWKINGRILDAAQHCWEHNIPMGDIPSRTDFDLPEEPVRLPPRAEKLEKGQPGYDEAVKESRAYREALFKFRRIKQRNMDLVSLRCSATLKLDQAEKFRDFEQIYFPYSVDFRGRAYPVPPHLSNVGSDLCRGLLRFAEAKPLGKRGMFWMKVHLANFAGMDKITFEERAKFIDDNIDKVRESAETPFEGERWWMSLDDPFQGLATCIEIIDALDSGDPESYMCSLPVHMDGSCNGLQHYAALGRDYGGGKAVNLCAMDRPQDVYSGVMDEVIRRVAEEAERELDFDTDVDPQRLSQHQKKELHSHNAAKLVNGLIDRGVVKRTVMTSVYGVTYIGARNQIQEKIESKLEAKGYDIDAHSYEIFQACGYLASLTMEVMGELFSGARNTMNWLTTCAQMISQHGYPVAWISPIGVPVIQPYRQKKSSKLVTIMQTVTLTDEHESLPIHKQRQVSAFPPNYVHSLDSSHMLLTALEMDRRNLTFSAVHDSFWTHACDIDEMNSALRDVFVEFYSRPLLEQLKKGWEMRYPDLTFPDLPEKGDLDLDEVKKAPYFFQ